MSLNLSSGRPYWESSQSEIGKMCYDCSAYCGGEPLKATARSTVSLPSGLPMQISRGCAVRNQFGALNVAPCFHPACCWLNKSDTFMQQVCKFDASVKPTHFIVIPKQSQTKLLCFELYHFLFKFFDAFLSSM